MRGRIPAAARLAAGLALAGCGGGASAAAPAEAAPAEEVMPEEAAAKLLKACHAEANAVACQALAAFFAEGAFGYHKDPKAAEELLKRSWAILEVRCEEGDAEQCALGGIRLSLVMSRLRPDDPRMRKAAEAAVPMLERACRGGEGVACAALGEIYANGSGVERDGKRAEAMFTAGCEAGDSGSCTSLGTHRLDAQDRAGAAEAYRRACDAGAAEARKRKAEGIPDAPAHVRGPGPPRWAQSCAMAGYQLATGDGVDADPKAAARYLDQGCEGGAAAACTTWGLLYLREAPGPVDPARAAALLRRGCEGGDAPGCGSLGHLYEIGSGVPKDEARALELFRRSCAGGDERGCQMVHRMDKPDRLILAPPRW